MTNEVVIRVTVNDDTKTTRDAIRAGFATTGTEAGRDFGEKARESIGRQAPARMPVEAKDPIDEAWRAQVQASMRGIARDAIKIPMSPDTAKYREELQLAVGELSSAVKQKIPVDTDGADQFKLHVEELAREVSAEVKAKIPVEADKQSASAAADSISAAAGARLRESGGQMSSALWASLVPAAPLVGAAAGAGIAGGLAVGLEGAVAVVAARNTQVKASFTALTADVKSKASEWGDAVSVPVRTALADVQARFDELSPQIRTVLVNASGSFQILTGAATDFASRAMPGVVTASQNLTPVLQGIRTMAGGLGQELGKDFAQISQHSEEVGTTFVSVGRIVDSLLGGITNLATEGLDVYAQHSVEVEHAVDAVTSSISSLATGALPVLGNAFGGEIRLATTFLNALQPIAPALGVFGGAALSAYTNTKLLGTLSGPIDSMATKLKGAGAEGTTFGTMTTKAGTALEKVGGALPAVGIGLSVVGSLMELAAQHGEDLAKAGDDVGEALAKGGSGAAAARQQLAQWQQDAANAKRTLDQLTAANVNAQTYVNSYGQEVGNAASRERDLTNARDDANTKITEALTKYNQYTATLGVAAITADQLAGKTAIYANSAQSASSNTSQLKAAMDTLKSAASTADQRIQALQTTLAILGDNGLQKAQDYAAQFGSALDSFSGQISTAKGAVFNLNHELNTNSERGRDVLQILEQSQQSWAGQAQAMANAGQSTDQINAALQGNQDQLRGVLAAAGLTKDQIQGLIDKYGLVPKNITTNVDANTAGAQGVIDSFIRMNNGRTIDIYTSVLGSGGIASAGRLAAGGVMGAASGRILGGDGLTLVGEDGPELIRGAVGSTVIPYSGVGKTLEHAMSGAMGQAGPAQIEVRFTGNTDQAFASAFMRLLRTGQIQILQQYINK